jgi:chromosome segregation ATPase
MTICLRRTQRQTLALMAMMAIVAGTAPSQAVRVGVVSQIDTFAVVIPQRPVEDIQKDIDAVQANRAHGKVWHQTASDNIQKLGTQIEVKKKEIDTLEAWEDAADNENKDVEVAALKAQIAGVERILDLLQEQKNMHSLEVDVAEASIDYADAAMSALEKETALITKRQERSAAAKAGNGVASLVELDKTIRQLEMQVIELQAQSLKKHDRYISCQQDLVSQQADVADAQARILER